MTEVLIFLLGLFVGFFITIFFLGAMQLNALKEKALEKESHE